MTAPVFDAKSISSISGRGKKNTPALLAFVSSALEAHADELEALMAATGFTAKNLSSILHSAGKNLVACIAALVANKEALKGIIDEKIFDAKSLSSMLHGAGKDLGAGIEALVDNKAALKRIIDEKTFDAKSLSSMLHGAGKNLGAGIEAIESHLPELKKLCILFQPSQIANRLSVVPKNKLGETIDRMVAIYEAEINGGTVLPPGAKSKILTASPAALKFRERAGV